MTRFEDMNEIDKLLKQIHSKYEQTCSQCNSLQKRLDEFNADEEIQKAHEETRRVKKYVESMRQHSLHIMSDKEMEANNRFIQKHYKTCSCGKAGITFEYGLTGTGIGTAIYIRCTKCGEREDITDFGNW